MSEKKISKLNKRSMGVFEYVFTSYEKLAERWKKSAVSRFSYRASASRAVASVRKRIARSSEKSMLLGVVRRFVSALPSVTLRAYGTFIFSLGFYSALVCVIKAIASTLETDTDSLVYGGVLMLAAIPLLLSGKTLADAVIESRVGALIAFDLLGYRPEAAVACKTVIKRCDISMIAGMAFGLCSFYVDISSIVAGILGVVAIYFILTVPEGGVAAFIALAPIMPMHMAKIYIALLFLGYVYKLATGRRTFKLDLADSAMLVFAFLIVLGDLIHYGNGADIGTGSHFALIAVYFLIVNLVRNDKWRETCRFAVAFGGVLTAVLFIASCYLPERVASLTFASGTLEGIKNTFLTLMETADTAVLYTSAVLPMLLVSVTGRYGGKRAGGAALCAALTLTAVIVSGSRSLWLGAAVGFSVLLVFVNKKFIIIPASVAALVPLSILILPDRFDVYVKRLFDFSGEGAVANVNVREDSIRILLDNVIGGIGSADGVFSSFYAAYTNSGVYPDSAKNLFLGVGVALGVTGLAVFVIALALLLVKMYTYAKTSSDSSAVSILAGVVSLVFIGVTVDIFADPKMFLLFFTYAAFVSSYTAVRPTPKQMLDKMPSNSEKAAAKDIEFE